MSFNRKRAALACIYCRHRKRRCDGGRPRCANCIESEVDCQYDETPSQRIDTSGGTREILGRLRDIESLLFNQSESIAALSDTLSNSRHISLHPDVTTEISPQSHASINNNPSQPVWSHPAASPWQADDYPSHSDTASLPPFTIPVRHKTSSTYLLSLPAMRSLVGEYPDDLFFQLESKIPLPSELQFDGQPSSPSPLQVDRNVTDYLVSAFFATAHLTHPVLDEDQFHITYNAFHENGVNSSIESALSLVVCALGAVASATPEQLQDLKNSPPGLKYMQHALPTLLANSSWLFSYRIQLAQALVLASIYFAYIVRPLQSWRLIYATGTILQFKFSGLDTSRDESASGESLLRLFWTCFLVECDRLAELELPRSGLQQLTDETSLPNCMNLGSMESTCYLAEISIRRLLNRIHNSLYPRKYHVLTLSSTSMMTQDTYTAEEMSSMSNICDELHRQLYTWHQSIPQAHRPSLNIESTGNDRATVLRIRYFAAQHIIYRPFVLYISANPNIPRSEALLEKAQICIESCRHYLHNTSEILRRPSQYTWTFSISSLGAVVVLTLASLSPDLQHLVPDIDELQTLAIRNIRPWAICSLEAVVSILEDIQRKQRILSRV